VKMYQMASVLLLVILCREGDGDGNLTHLNSVSLCCASDIKKLVRKRDVACPEIHKAM
jgi:hypothetical protein